MKKLTKSFLLLLLVASMLAFNFVAYAEQDKFYSPDETDTEFVSCSQYVEEVGESDEDGEDEFELAGDIWQVKKTYDIENTTVAIKSTTGLDGLTIDNNYYGAPLKDSSDGTVRYSGQSTQDSLDEAWHGMAYMELSAYEFKQINTQKVVLEYDVLCLTDKTGMYFRAATKPAPSTRTSFPFIRSGIDFEVGEWTKIDIVMGNQPGDTSCEIYANGKLINTFKMPNYGVAGSAWIHPYIPDRQYIDMYFDNIKIIAADSMKEFVQSELTSDNSEIVITDDSVSGIEYGAFAEDVIAMFETDDQVFIADKNFNIAEDNTIVDNTMKLISMTAEGLYTYRNICLKYLVGDLSQKIAIVRISPSNVILCNLKSMNDAAVLTFVKSNGIADGKVYFCPLDGTVNEHSFELEKSADSKLDISAFCINTVSAYSNIEDATDINFDLAAETGMTVSGNAEPGTDVLMFVMKPGEEFDPSVLTQQTSTDKIYTVLGSTADENGKFVFDLIAFENSGKYNYVVFKDGKVYGASKSAPGKDIIYEFKNALNNLKSASELEEIIDADLPLGNLGLDYTYYSKLSNSEREFVCSEVMKAMNIPNAEEISIDEFANQLKYRSAICAVVKDWGDGSKPKSNIYKVLDVENKIFNLSGSSTDAYNEMPEDKKLEVCEHIYRIGNSIKNPETLKMAFDIAVINTELDGYYTHNDVYTILQSHKDLLEDLNFDNYAKLTSKLVDVNESILKAGPFKSADELVKKANSEIIKAQKAEADAKKDSGKKTTGGGGSGSGSTISSSIPLNQLAKPVETDTLFSDLNTVPWAQEAINVLCKKGIVSGRGNKCFDPDNTITREEFVKMIVEAKGLTTYTQENTFSDVDKMQWYSKYISIAVENGIVKGVDKNNFGIGQNLSRQDMMVMCCALLNDTQNYVDISSLKDYNEISDYAINAVAKLIELGIVSGDDGGKIMPKADCTRAQAAKVVYLLLKTINN